MSEGFVVQSLGCALGCFTEGIIFGLRGVFVDVIQDVGEYDSCRRGQVWRPARAQQKSSSVVEAVSSGGQEELTFYT